MFTACCGNIRPGCRFLPRAVFHLLLCVFKLFARYLSWPHWLHLRKICGGNSWVKRLELVGEGIEISHAVSRRAPPSCLYCHLLATIGQKKIEDASKKGIFLSAKTQGSLQISFSKNVSRFDRNALPYQVLLFPRNVTWSTL